MKPYFLAPSFLTGIMPRLLFFLTLFICVHAPFHHVGASDNTNWLQPSDNPESLSDKHERLSHVLGYFRQEAMGLVTSLPDTVRAPVGWAEDKYQAAEDSIGMQIHPSYNHGFVMSSEMKFDDTLSLNTTLHDSDAAQSGNSIMLRWKLFGD